jgi:hypothetical protein
VLSLPSPNKARWRAVQLALLARLRHFGADPLPAGDEARVLRLIPYPNRKLWPDGIATAIVLETAARYALSELATAVIREEPVGETPAARHLARFIPPPRERGAIGADTDGMGQTTEEPPPGPELTGERMRYLADTAAAVREALAQYIAMHLKQGIHYGIIPPSDPRSPPSKPTLFKAGAELIMGLFSWRAHFYADLETLGMYGGSTAGVFAYVCQLVDQRGRVVAQGRGLTELREPTIWSANMAVKLAEKRSMVDAVLRGAGLSAYFVQDLEDAEFDALRSPGQAPGPPAEPEATGTQGQERAPTWGGCTTAQRGEIRRWLERSGKNEEEVLAQLGITSFAELTRDRADRLIRRLVALGVERQKKG